MFGSQMLEVAIGVIFVFLLVSVICSAIREGVEACLKTRAAYLERGIRGILSDPDGNGIAKELYNHPLISGLFTGTYTTALGGWLPWVLKPGGNLPSYIPSKNFALALMDIAARGPKTGIAGSVDDSAPITSLAAIRSNIANIGNPDLQRALLSAIDSAQGNLNQAQANIEAWFDSGMDRVSGWYKRSTQWIIFVTGLAIAFGLNVNAISIAQHLYGDEGLRTAVFERAKVVGSNASIESFDAAKKELSTALPIGWGVAPGFADLPAGNSIAAWRDWSLALVLLLFGWLITAFAASMGAPFWFDVLNKFMVIRSTVKPHEKSPEESSEDRQTGTGSASTPDEAGVSLLMQMPSEAIPPNDTESVLDGCDVAKDDETPDESLPASEGGVA